MAHPTVVKSLQGTLIETADLVLNLSNKQRIFLLEGVIGSGKTTLVQALCKALGCIDKVQSPTFSLINEYDTIKKALLYHFDCYRLQKIEDTLLLDFEGYFSSGSYCFIEWPSKIKAIWPLHYFLIQIEVETPTSRNLICSSF